MEARLALVARRAIPWRYACLAIRPDRLGELSQSILHAAIVIGDLDHGELAWVAEIDPPHARILGKHVVHRLLHRLLFAGGAEVAQGALLAGPGLQHASTVVFVEGRSLDCALSARFQGQAEFLIVSRLRKIGRLISIHATGPCPFCRRSLISWASPSR